MNEFSFKELEQCYLKATYPIEIGSRTIETKEILAAIEQGQSIGIFIGPEGGFSQKEFDYFLHQV